MREKKRRETSTRAKYYIPNQKVEQFIKMVGSDKHFVNMLIGANGIGKTAIGANIITNICYGIQNEWFNHELFKKFPYMKKGRIISDPTTIKEKIIPELQKWFPANESKRVPDANFETTKNGKNYVSKFITNTGWEIDIMSTEQDEKEFESVDLGFVWIDEPMPKKKFIATLARGRMGMIVFWTYTPLFYSGWIKDWIDENIDSGEADYIEAEMEDACITHGVRGTLQHKHIKRIADSIPEDEKQARVFGKFGHLIGKVHKKFNRKIHVIKPFPINEKDWTTYIALDPHPRVPDHVLYLSVNKKGTKVITSELISDGLIKTLYSRMIKLESAMNFRIEDRIIDPSAYNDDQHRKEKTIGSQLFDLGMNFIKGSKDLHAGIKRTDTAFDFELKSGVMVREPELYIFDTCRITIKQLENYVWDEYRGRGSDDKKKKGQPKDKDDHQPENLHRLLLHEPKFIPYEYRNSTTIPFHSEDSKVEEHGFDPYE